MSEVSCAYCGGPGPFTREHVIPKFLYTAHPSHRLGYNAAADKFMSWEAKIKDVCAACNNGPLSNLDAYGKSFYTVNGCGRTFDRKTDISISYDFNLLLRWVLKISFNAARTRDTVHPAFRQSVPYIIGGDPMPFTPFLGVEVVRNHPVRKKDRWRLPAEAKGWKSIPPLQFRVGPMFAVTPGGRHHKDVLTRFFSINAFFFVVALFPSSMNEGRRASILNSTTSNAPSLVLLDSAKAQATLSVSATTGLQRYIEQGVTVQRQWLDYLRETKQIEDATRG